MADEPRYEVLTFEISDMEWGFKVGLYVADFFNIGIRVAYFFVLFSNQKYLCKILPHSKKPLNNTFLPTKNLKF